jgi:hypothetical protein
MLSENKNMPKSLMLTYVSAFAALNTVANFIPFTPVLGIPGSSFRLGWVMAPLTGILLGAKIGGISCLLSGLIGIFLGQPPIFGPFTPISPAASAFVTGMLVLKKWRISAIALSSLILLWLMLPTGQAASTVLIFHTVGLGMILLFREKIGDLARSGNAKSESLGLLLAAYCGNISRHLFGNILSATILNLSATYFVSAFPYTLAEQLTFAVGTMIMGVSLSHMILGSSQLGRSRIRLLEERTSKVLTRDLISDC